jgi:quinoprotein glucose dehydrogenase
VILGLAAASPGLAADKDWAIYGGTSQDNHYSTLTQITKANVVGLTQAWRFDMSAAGDPQTHPLAINGVIYAYTPDLKVVALDGAPGKLVWTFESGVEAGAPQRGLTWFEDKDGVGRCWTAYIKHHLLPNIVNNSY